MIEKTTKYFGAGFLIGIGGSFISFHQTKKK
jgi:hypothetical protein